MEFKALSTSLVKSLDDLDYEKMVKPFGVVFITLIFNPFSTDDLRVRGIEKAVFAIYYMEISSEKLGRRNFSER